MRLAVILVHYHTPELAAAAVEALRTDLAGTGAEVEWRLVDNGSDEAGRALLAALPLERIDPGTNLGYAGGGNPGGGRATPRGGGVVKPRGICPPRRVQGPLDALGAGAARARPPL